MNELLKCVALAAILRYIGFKESWYFLPVMLILYTKFWRGVGSRAPQRETIGHVVVICKLFLSVSQRTKRKPFWRLSLHICDAVHDNIRTWGFGQTWCLLCRWKISGACYSSPATSPWKRKQWLKLRSCFLEQTRSSSPDTWRMSMDRWWPIVVLFVSGDDELVCKRHVHCHQTWQNNLNNVKHANNASLCDVTDTSVRFPKQVLFE